MIKSRTKRGWYRSKTCLVQNATQCRWPRQLALVQLLFRWGFYLFQTPYLGYRFETKLTELKTNNIISTVDETNLRNRCCNFLLLLFGQLKQRLPTNLNILKKVSLFSVKNMLQPVKDIPNICGVMKFLGASDNCLSQAQYQLNKINLVDWHNKTDTDAF